MFYVVLLIMITSFIFSLVFLQASTDIPSTLAQADLLFAKFDIEHEPDPSMNRHIKKTQIPTKQAGNWLEHWLIKVKLFPKNNKKHTICVLKPLPKNWSPSFLTNPKAISNFALLKAGLRYLKGGK